MYSIIYQGDSIAPLSTIYTPDASYHFAALEDSFLYTTTPGEIVCINVADPESIFIHRTLHEMSSLAGLEAIDGYVYLPWKFLGYDEITSTSWVHSHIARADMINSASPTFNYYFGPAYPERYFGSITGDGEYIFFVNTELSSWPDWEIGESDFYVHNTDSSYTFDDKWDGQPAIGVEIVNDHLAAVGFKHGFSILDIDDLSDIHEVAYYMDPDSEFYCTHFAMKDTVLYAVAHPAAGGCRLYMFYLADSVASGQAEAVIPWKPDEMKLRSYPNPFNSSVRFAVEASGVCDTPLRVEIYDVNGRKIADAEPVEAGAGRLTKDTSTSSVSVFAPLTKGGQGGSYIWTPDESLPSGVYLVRASAGGRGDLDPGGPSTGSGTVATARIVYLK